MFLVTTPCDNICIFKLDVLGLALQSNSHTSPHSLVTHPHSPHTGNVLETVQSKKNKNAYSLIVLITIIQLAKYAKSSEQQKSVGAH